MELGRFIEGRLIKGAAHQPRLVAVAEEIALAQVLDPDQSLFRIVKVNLWRANVILLEELRDLDVMPVLFAIEGVLNEDERLLGRTAHALKLAIRAAFFDR